MSYFVVWRHISPQVGKDDEVLEILKPIIQHAKDSSDAVVGLWVWKKTPEEPKNGIVPWMYGEAKGRPFTGEEPAVMIQEVETDHQAFVGSVTYKAFEADTQGLLTCPPHEQHLVPGTGFPFRDGNPYKTTDKLHAVTARVAYKPGTLPQGVDCWKTVASYVKESEVDGTLMYWFLTDAADPTGLHSLEVYRDVDAFDVHKVCDAVVNNRSNQVDVLKIRTGVEIRDLKQVMSSFD
ncbi:hypothetical protein SBRCBS47491_000831 [Sporothrix bragantina]|uniref:ABM domain-containing protein n=1 Tax=Sporothrix bragantina TaxID=671064 RepID=A0ABP0ATM7_9PEZI